MGYLILGFLIIVLIDLPPLIKQKRVRELTIIGLLFVAVFTLATFYLAGIFPVSPIAAVGNFMKQMFHWDY